MALVTMYDAVDPANVPRDAQAVAGYFDGHYVWTVDDWALFPGVPHVPITVFGAPSVRVCDCEAGDLTPARAAAWAASEVSSGRRPTIYCNTSTMPAVKTALAALNLSLGTAGEVDWWQAQYDGVAVLARVNGVMPVAKQYAGSPGNSPGPYDVSVADPAWLGTVPTPPAPPPPPPTPSRSADMGKTAHAARPDGSGIDHFGIRADGVIDWQPNIGPITDGSGSAVPAPVAGQAVTEIGALWYQPTPGGTGELFLFAQVADTLLQNRCLPDWQAIGVDNPAWSWGGWEVVMSGLAAG